MADQANDDTTAFPAAIDAAVVSGGGIVVVPAGAYRINVALIVKRNVTLEGIFTAPPTIPRTAESLGMNAPNGSVLLAFIRNLNGAPLYRGLFIDHCLDVCRVENVHFWPFWGATGAAAEF